MEIIVVRGQELKRENEMGECKKKWFLVSEYMEDFV